MGSNPRVDKRSQVSIEKSPGILEEKSTLKQAGDASDLLDGGE